MKCDELKTYTIYEGDVGNYTEHVVYNKQDVDDTITELKQKLEDAGMRERRLKRALYKACASWARTAAMSFWNRWEDVNFRKWQKVKRKCLKKAKEYK